MCGWEGRDLIDAIEDRWTQVDLDTFERESALVGALAAAEVSREQVRLPTADPAALRDWLREVGPQLPTAVASAVTSIEDDASGVVVTFGYGPAPALQEVRQRFVACHLHGVTERPDGPSV